MMHHAQTLRNTPLSTRGNVSFFGDLGYELDLKHLLPTEEKEIASQIAFYKRYRSIFQFGALHRIKADYAYCWQVSGGNTHLAGLFHRLQHAAPGYEQLRVLGLDKEKLYRVTSLEQVSQRTFTSLPTRSTVNDVPPQGCFFFIFTIS